MRIDYISKMSLWSSPMNFSAWQSAQIWINPIMRKWSIGDHGLCLTFTCIIRSIARCRFWLHAYQRAVRNPLFYGCVRFYFMRCCLFTCTVRSNLILYLAIWWCWLSADLLDNMKCEFVQSYKVTKAKFLYCNDRRKILKARRKQLVQSRHVHIVLILSLGHYKWLEVINQIVAVWRSPRSMSSEMSQCSRATLPEWR